MIRLTATEAAAALKQVPEAFVTVLRHGSIKVEWYQPEKIDRQTPHVQDEIYVIASGSGTFFINGKRTEFGTGDVLFVKAGAEHRFETFTDDFVTWVIFYGPEGGE